MNTSVARLYDEHVRELPAAQRLESLALIVNELTVERVTIHDNPRRHLTELRGLGKEIWEGIDAQEYVDRLRGPWPDEVP